ncbi:MAG: type II toxin-antitoxin system VapC family toxin [Verrucomicrobiota bacterium]
MYCDSCILVKLLTDEPDSEFFNRELSGQPLSTSELALTEVFAALLAKERAGRIRPADRRRAWNQLQEWVENEQIVLHPLITRTMAKARQQLDFCHPDVPLRTLDAVHVAACDLSQDFPLATTDQRMRDAAERLRIPTFPPAGRG